MHEGGEEACGVVFVLEEEDGGVGVLNAAEEPLEEGGFGAYATREVGVRADNLED